MANTNKTVANKRPTFLTVWLILIMVFNTIDFLSYTLGYSTLVHHHDFTGGEVIAIAIISLLEFVGALLIWKWYKSGLYLAVFCAVAIIFADPSLSKREFSVAYSFIGITILYLAMRPTWHSFR